MSDERLPSARAVLNSAIGAVRDVFLPELSSPWARASAAQLVGMLVYTRDRVDGLHALAVTDLRVCIATLFAEQPALAARFGDVEAAAAARGGGAWGCGRWRASCLCSRSAGMAPIATRSAGGCGRCWRSSSPSS